MEHPNTISPSRLPVIEYLNFLHALLDSHYFQTYRYKPSSIIAIVGPLSRESRFGKDSLFNPSRLVCDEATAPNVESSRHDAGEYRLLLNAYFRSTNKA